ncbi:Peptidoglycan recognition protein 1 [Halotydeus destructor]|nr:Peptidoglycan recognition protein 1 [Halotydeus destructor]
MLASTLLLTALISAAIGDGQQVDHCNALMVPKSKWDKMAPSDSNTGTAADIRGQAKFVIVEMTDTKATNNGLSVLKINADRAGEPDIDYNFVIGPHNVVYEGRSWAKSFANNGRDKESNTIKIGILGHEDTLPTPRMWATVVNLIQCGQQLGHLGQTYQLRTDSEPCLHSMSSRLVGILQQASRDGDFVPKLVCQASES